MCNLYSFYHIRTHALQSFHWIRVYVCVCVRFVCRTNEKLHHKTTDSILLYIICNMEVLQHASSSSYLHNIFNDTYDVISATTTAASTRSTLNIVSGERDEPEPRCSGSQHTHRRTHKFCVLFILYFYFGKKYLLLSPSFFFFLLFFLLFLWSLLPLSLLLLDRLYCCLY